MHDCIVLEMGERMYVWAKGVIPNGSSLVFILDKGQENGENSL